jgi:hypothetical protein
MKQYLHAQNYSELMHYKLRSSETKYKASYFRCSNWQTFKFSIAVTSDFSTLNLKYGQQQSDGRNKTTKALKILLGIFLLD